MTVISYPDHNRPGASLVRPVLFFLVAMALGWKMLPTHKEQQLAGSSVGVVAIKSIPTVVPDQHADDEHPVDVALIRKCLGDKKGADVIWRHANHEKFYCYAISPMAGGGSKPSTVTPKAFGAKSLLLSRVMDRGRSWRST